VTEIPKITEPMKANWAMAHVKIEHRKQLNAALRRCKTGEGFSVPPREAVEEVRRIGQVIAGTADAALALLDEEAA
jgi:hypothetical protein